MVPTAPPRYILSLTGGPLENGCRPAADRLFRSINKSIIGDVLAVILTGMGQDGLNGIRLLKDRGRTVCITQSERSCVVYGMPAAVDEAGLSDLSIPIEKMAETITAIVKGRKKVPV
jgi:two-component system chemotaxis response regulator CheB